MEAVGGWPVSAAMRRLRSRGKKDEVMGARMREVQSDGADAEHESCVMDDASESASDSIQKRGRSEESILDPIRVCLISRSNGKKILVKPPHCPPKPARPLEATSSTLLSLLRVKKQKKTPQSCIASTSPPLLEARLLYLPLHNISTSLYNV